LGKTGCNSEFKVDMAGSGGPAQTNVIAAHGTHGPHRPDSGRTAKV